MHQLRFKRRTYSKNDSIFGKGFQLQAATQMFLSHSMSTSDDKNIIFNLFAELLYLNHFANDCVMHFDFISSAPQ